VDEHEFLRDIERLLKREIPQEVIAGFEPDPRARAQPILQRQGRGQSQGRGGAPGQQRRVPASGRGGGSQPRGAPAVQGLRAGGNGRQAPVGPPPRHGARNATSTRAHAPKAPAFRSGTRER
jgi:ATP-dependent RNA helicase RhlE